MEIPQEILDHMEDEFPHCDLFILGHLIQLQTNAVRLYVLSVNPYVLYGSVFISLTAQQLKEANELLEAVKNEWCEYHSFRWIRDVKYTLSQDGTGTILVPDAYEHVMRTYESLPFVEHITRQPTLN